MVFDWSAERRSGLVSGSQTVLADFLESKDVTPENKKAITDLWGNVIGIFQTPRNSTQELVINGESIANFDSSELPTHSEYHIAKVVTLVTSLYDKVVPAEYQTSENVLALSISAIIHDIGLLQEVGEDGPQERFYKHHELRALAMVDPIVEALHLPEYEEVPDKKNAFKNKIKMFIASTVPAWNLDFGQGAKIKRLIQPEGNPISLEEVKKNLNLEEGEPDALTNTAENLFQVFESFSQQPSNEMLMLAQVMSAADHGTYMLEPSRISEIIGLWQELNRMWIGSDNKLTHRSLPPETDNYLRYLTSGFAGIQWKTFGETLKEIGDNPFVNGETPISVAEMKTYAEKIVQLLAEKSDFDSLLRFEGSFSPIQLVALAGEMQLDNNRQVVEAIEVFSKSFAYSPSRTHSFDALSTSVLKRMYKNILQTQRPEFLKKALSIMLDEVDDEMTDAGVLNLHIAPQAYISDTEESLEVFLDHLQKAHGLLDEAHHKRIQTIYLTLREDQGDDINLFRQTIKNYGAENKKPPLGLSIACIPFGMSIANLVDQEKDETYPLLIHFGLEKSGDAMNDRLDELMNTISLDDRTLLSRMSIHIDDKFREFMDYYKNHPEHQILLKEIPKSIAPLGYMLTQGNKGYDTMEEFYEVFGSGIHVGSNNPSMHGDLGLSAQRLAYQFYNSH
ncbi:MAG: hypothetical protein COU09_02670 [Candidatus Harrisonbacteria bacterium CG10_big_fil_rev_8_21_14_0_10_44_23]|uniref:Uncharacterized protein n=1 Tax=Candidatus Harrisonbacteria bacterium CG10_big_fil_rev_8_21_14_0_10_44_23 TaxID=1974585 RepID=A0A2H0UPL5_9BACT|nr:MAG: hypothetical protein COU09_02670 [Candidatus Harrisonbacteria bacterium CG10_big_fil_rev_8_21_14_0_10_44_23]